MSDLRPGVWTSHFKCHGNNIPYAQALRSLAEVAVKHKALLDLQRVEKEAKRNERRVHQNARNIAYEDVSVIAANGRRCVHDVLAPCSTPATDTSAMDGFAVDSTLTIGASTQHPVKFRIAGIMAAGMNLGGGERDRFSNPPGVPPCVEIMTGACFPEQQFPHMDATVKVEDVVVIEDKPTVEGLGARYILVSVPVKARQHRRPAGSDFSEGDLIVAKNTCIEPKHVMALTSVGISTIRVLPDLPSRAAPSDVQEERQSLSVGVLSTGSELLNLFDPNLSTVAPSAQRFPDSNGPYVTSALESLSPSLQVDYLGPCLDDEQTLAETLRGAVEDEQYDIVVTSGGVSMGRFDLVRKVIESRPDVDVVFHGCLVRPGAPVLFSISERHCIDGHQPSRAMTAFFGAPGNPLAAAMTFRFFLKPYLDMLHAPRSLVVDQLVQLVLSQALPTKIVSFGMNEVRKKPTKAVAFLLARRQIPRCDKEIPILVELLEDQASYKVKPFLQADCWIVAPVGIDKICSGDEVLNYSLW